MNEIEKELQEVTEKVEIWDNSKRAKNLIIIFWVLIAGLSIGLISSYIELNLLKNIQLGEYTDENEYNSNDTRQGIIAIIQIGIYITSAVLFLNWFRRAYGNLHRIGIRHLKHKESMALWTWFIPIIVLFRPVQIMNEIWNTTQEKIKKYDTSYLIKNGTLGIGLWWTLFIISNFIGRYAIKNAFKQNTIEQLLEYSQVMMVSDFMQILEALLVIWIVLQLSKMETRLAHEVKKSGGIIIYK